MRWLILTSATGTGHNMRADSLRRWAGKVYGNKVEVRIHAALEETHGVYRFGVNLYNFIQRHWPRAHHVYFNVLEMMALHREAGRIRGSDRFQAVIKDWQPERIVSVHAHTNHGFFALARQCGLPVEPRCVTYCGELSGGYGFSRHWTNAYASGFIGATEEVCAAAVAVGLPPARVMHGGFMLRPAFYASADAVEVEARELATELGLRRDAFTVVLSTGLSGANNHLEILPRLAAAGRPMQVIALCGHNHHSRERVEAFAAAQAGPLVIRALEHTENMVAVKGLASVIVARPGTGATSEAILLGLPLVHNGIGGTMPQELITVKYCKHHGCGLLGSTAQQIVDHLVALETQPEDLAALGRRMRAARPPGRPEDICRWIHDCP
jgi:processive 1,2-diacylglycerol beta-glucosyltransferase